MTEFAVTLERTIPGPRPEVYRAFLDPELLQQWMSPPEFVVSAASVDEHVGGRHVVELLAPDGQRHALESVIRDLVENERIVLDLTFVGPDPPMRQETLFTVTFRDAGPGATHVRLEQERIGLTGPLNPQSVNTGWSCALDNLQALYERSQ